MRVWVRTAPIHNQRPRPAPSRLLVTTVLFVGIGITGLVAPGCAPRRLTDEDPPVAYLRAEEAFRVADFEGAARHYRTFLDSSTRQDLEPRAYYRLAYAELRRGNHQACLAALDQLEDRFPDPVWPQVQRLRGDAEEARGNPVSALYWWERAWQATEGDERTNLMRRMDGLVNQLDIPALSQAATLVTTPELQAAIARRTRSLENHPGPTKPRDRPD